MGTIVAGKTSLLEATKLCTVLPVPTQVVKRVDS
jgi:hypothetical protein